MRLMLKDTRGGSTETEWTDKAVKPTGPVSPAVVMAQTLETARRNTGRRSGFTTETTISV